MRRLVALLVLLCSSVAYGQSVSNRPGSNIPPGGYIFGSGITQAGQNVTNDLITGKSGGLTITSGTAAPGTDVLTLRGDPGDALTATVDGAGGISAVQSANNNSALIRVLAGGTVMGTINGYGSAFPGSGALAPSSMGITGQQSGGLSLVAGNAAGVINFYSGGSATRAMQVDANNVVRVGTGTATITLGTILYANNATANQPTVVQLNNGNSSQFSGMNTTNDLGNLFSFRIFGSTSAAPEGPNSATFLASTTGPLHIVNVRNGGGNLILQGVVPFGGNVPGNVQIRNTGTPPATHALDVDVSENPIASAAGATWDGSSWGGTATLSGSTNITTASGFNANTFNAPTITSGSALTVTSAATLVVGGAPIAAGSTTITNGYAVWVQGGATRLDATLNLSNIAAATAELTITATSDTPATTWVAGVPNANPSGFLKLSVGGANRYMPFWP